MPVCILAGSDQRPAPAPRSLPDGEMLTGFKGALLFPTGRSLASEVVTRLRASGRFQDPLLMGPSYLYAPLVDCEIVDIDGPLISTLRRTIQVVQQRFSNAAAVAVITCDIIPTANEIDRLLAVDFDPHLQCHFWWQWVTASPEALGVSGWKPTYTIRPRDKAPAEIAYPGHLVIFRPQAVRLELFAQLLTLAYDFRNRPLPDRVLPMLGRGICKMLEIDAKNLLHGQLPVLTAAIPWHLLRAYRELQSHRLTVPGLERHCARALLHRRFRGSDRPVVIALTRILSFAQDIDTKMEWAEACRRITAQA